MHAQLERTKSSALRLKRDGKTKDAIEMLRRMKQIEALIEKKQQLNQQQQQQQQEFQSGDDDPVRLARFDELERLLVEFSNRAMNEAKEMLSKDRTKAAELVKKV